MPIPVECSNCQARLNAPDAAAGKKVKCPKCQSVIVVPGAAAPPPPTFEVVPEPPGGSNFDFSGPSPPPPPAKRSGTTDRPAPLPPPPPPEDAGGGFDFSSEPAPAPAASPRPARSGAAPRPAPRAAAGDTPPRRAGTAAKAGGKKKPPILLILLGASLVLLLCCGGVGGVGYYIYTSFVRKAQEVVKNIDKDLQKGLNKINTPPSGSGDVGGPKAAVPTGWVELAPTGAGFNAFVPTLPKGADDPGDPEEGIPKMYVSPGLSQKVNCVIVVQKLKDVPAALRDRAFEEMSKSVTATGGKQLSRKDAKLGGLPATEVVVEMPGGMPKGGKAGKQQAVFRLLKTDTANYMVQIMHLGAGRPPADLEKGFFDNFEVVK